MPSIQAPEIDAVRPRLPPALDAVYLRAKINQLENTSLQMVDDDVAFGVSICTLIYLFICSTNVFLKCNNIFPNA